MGFPKYGLGIRDLRVSMGIQRSKVRIQLHIVFYKFSWEALQEKFRRCRKIPVLIEYKSGRRIGHFFRSMDGDTRSGQRNFAAGLVTVYVDGVKVLRWGVV